MSFIERYYYHSFLGDEFLTILGDGTTLVHIGYDNYSEDEPVDNTAYPDVCRQLDEYFAGKRKTFDVALNLSSGTALQQQHWQHLRDIPYGETCTYSELAAKSSSPKAVRAAASACAVNPFPILIPCHRVQGKDGTLRGFAWGIELKQRLLDLERAFHFSD
jgi:methylated-DNA-[protein]-cysteine S-methyltransferase